MSRDDGTRPLGLYPVAMPQSLPHDDYPPWRRDEDLIVQTAHDTRPRVRISSCREVEVVIGRGGKADLELRRDAIHADDIPVYRRRGGGCAVVLDPGNLVVSLAAPMSGIGGVTSAFGVITDWLTGGLATAGIPGVRGEGVSDLTLDDRKVGGSCIYRTRGFVYYASTLLADPDLDLVERYLAHPPREPQYRRGRDHRTFMGRLPAAAAPGFGERLRAVLAATTPDLGSPPSPLTPPGRRPSSG